MATINISISKNCASEFWFNPSRSNFFGFRGDANQVTEAYTAQVFTTVSIITQAKNDKDVIEFFVDLVIEIVCTLVIYAMILRGLCFIQLQSDFLFFVVFIGFVF